MSTPREVVEENFRRMATPDERETAAELYADDVVIDLPGASFEGPDAAEEMVAYFDSQYEWCNKNFELWWETDDAAIVFGELYGVDDEGEEFDGVRFIDVHVVSDGKIREKYVFNDLSEAGLVDYDDL